MKKRISETQMSPELVKKIQCWLVSFHRLDPRYKILTFFNQVAADGADNMRGDDDEEDEIDLYDLNRSSDHLSNLLTSSNDNDYNNNDNDSSRPQWKPSASFQEQLKKAFNATSILTVWRPCSNDAMRKMMEGTGVGKGLDIKGKSAKRGLLSAFVPFMQIHENSDKQHVQELSFKAKMRVYYHSEAARKLVIQTLEPYATPPEAAKETEYKIPSYCKILDTYKDTGLYGIEVSQRLFWQGCIVPQDISRTPETETGRASMGGFQDLNMKTLKVACSQMPPPSPMPCVIQHDKDLALRPQTLLMAYEEHGTVTPVVSDFDGFLLGWRREALWFGCNLPREQEDLMLWCVDHIEDLLDCKPSSDPWTVQWMEMLKQESARGFKVEMPQYGFGDPKSYGIMENAAKRLIDTGAVRHGSECFNYYFPQEIDDYFLLVSDTLSPVPWKYVNVTELQSILSQKIKEGFVFPLNPKWVLCDPGWKKVYDELMKSDALYADLSKDVWFPPHSGIRERIEEICRRHPYGFQQARHNQSSSGRNSFEKIQSMRTGVGRPSKAGHLSNAIAANNNMAKGYSPLRKNLDRGLAMTGTIAFDLATLELDQFAHMHRKNKLAKQIADASLASIMEKNATGVDISDMPKKDIGGKNKDNDAGDDDNNNQAEQQEALDLVPPLSRPSQRRRLFMKQREEDRLTESANNNVVNKRMMFSLSQFESKAMQRRNLSYTFNAEKLRPELVEKIRNWLVSFYQLDPRYKILTFFNKVAADGADNLVGEEEDESYIYDLQRDIDHLGLKLNATRQPKSLQERLNAVFDATSILTVWRPCSNDAMRKMMEGTGVGKGLDIKGKSAQKGILSAFVPFMQIHENHDKAQIEQLYEKAKMRVYFHSQEARQTVIDTILPYANTSEDAEYRIPDYLELLDTYAEKDLYGIEVSQRLFWEGLIVPQDITRDEDTITGRASLSGFQDANMKTLKVACSKKPRPSPMPVVMQYDKENPIRPQTLVMAYEENGSVTPVVSDFDGFLLGWRREALWFGCNLPREQEKLMMWCLQHIEDLLDARPSSDSWTVQWLEILKRESSNGFVPEIPEYGFGDPKSYGIMEKAAQKLIDTGAVRHGSECFNYYFPQEIDDYFLLVSDTLRPVPWKYVNVTELQEILIQKIKEGFVFPLNPKWVLCDPGWKRVYDELMASQALYAEECKDVWFPRHSGIRERIEDIHTRHPNGFCRNLSNATKKIMSKAGSSSSLNNPEYCPLRKHLARGVAMTGNMAFDLATLELENFNQDSRKNQLAKQIAEAGLNSMDLDDIAEGDEDGENDDDDLVSPMTRKKLFLQRREEEKIGNESATTSVEIETKRLMFSLSHLESRDLPRRNFTSLPEMDEL